MELKIGTRTLKVFRYLNRTARECTVKIDKNKGLETKVMTWGNEIYHKVIIPKEEFHKFKVNKNKEIGLDLEQFDKVLKLFGRYTTLKLKIDSNELTISDSNRKLSVPLIETQEIELPKVDKSKFQLKDFELNRVNRFRKALKFAEFITGNSINSGEMNLRVENNELYAEANGERNGTHFKNRLEEVKQGLEKHTKNKPCFWGLYNVRHLDNVTRGYNVVKISFGKNTVLEVNGEVHGATVNTLIAPKIDEHEHEQAEEIQQPTTEHTEEKAVVKATA